MLLVRYRAEPAAFGRRVKKASALFDPFRKYERVGAGKRSRLGAWITLVIKQDPAGGAVQILVLPAAQRPQERGQSETTQQQRRRNQIDEDRHDSLVRPSRNALQMTRIEDDDIASAAISGVTRPTIASGTAARL